LYLLVGSSETACPQSYSWFILVSCYTVVIPPVPQPAVEQPKSNSKAASTLCFNEWLAGLIDGDGCFLISKAGYVSCEITVSLADEPMLLRVKQQLGGSVKLRSGCKAVRYRLHNIPGMIELVNRVNGHIRNSVRVVQLVAICAHLGIEYIPPRPLRANSCWYAGFFDADGTITFSLKAAGSSGKLRPQVYISVTNKYKQDVDMFQAHFGGPIYVDTSQNSYYKWMITRRELVDNFISYAKIAPVRSTKAKRLHLLPEFYNLVAMNAYDSSAPTNIRNAWAKFVVKWDAAK
ncbi:MAG TPA: LAGLIDADG family homing endonuclease, partial [Methylotenera sp.]|nr:LAGLIDADG family homing endonuclease [Methylotenera sp.]